MPAVVCCLNWCQKQRIATFVHCKPPRGSLSDRSPLTFWVHAVSSPQPKVQDRMQLWQVNPGEPPCRVLFVVSIGVKSKGLQHVFIANHPGEACLTVSLSHFVCMQCHHLNPKFRTGCSYAKSTQGCLHECCCLLSQLVSKAKDCNICSMQTIQGKLV